MRQKEIMKNMNGRLFLLLALLLFVPLGLFAQSITVKGTVVDETGETVIGASVVEKGNPSNGVITNFDGQFTLTVPKGKMLVVSYVGYISQEVEAVAGEELRITLREDSQSLDEVVVIGYGVSQVRKDLTGSVGSVSGAKLAQVPVASAGEALQGKIAGVQVTTVDGAPGADINIRIRGGGTSLSGDNSKPLFVVDGFITDNINDIPPTDIQSIDVLKDASLTAIYGAKGGNGVVIVTTKSAQAGKLKVEFNTYWQARQLSGKLDLLDTYEFVRYQLDGTVASNSKIHQFRNDFGNPNDLDIYQHAVTHDWQDEIMGSTPITQMYNVTVKGGSDNIKLSTSLTHHDERGVVESSGVRRTNMNTKIDVKLSDRVSLLFNPRFTYRRDMGAGGDEERNWMLASPRDDIDQNYRLRHSYTFTNQASLTWKIIDGLTFRSDIAQSWRFRDDNRFYGYLTDEAADNNDMPVAEITNDRQDKYVWTNTLNYQLSLRDEDVHNFSFLLGHEMQHTQTTTNFEAARYFPQQTPPRSAFANMGLGTAYQTTSSVSTPDRMLSFFGQANYNYKHKYLVSLTFRADGSTKFAPGDQWGYFPSISGAWVLSEEPFMQDIDWISQFKIRAAFGMAGNNEIDSDLWRYQYSISSTGGPSWGETTLNGEGYYQNGSGSTFPNKDIKWETTITRNLALDLSFFDGRLNITPEFYWNTTRDLLYESMIPSTTGYTRQMQNVGQVTNKGFELTIGGDLYRSRDAVLSANFTMGINKTHVDHLNGDDKELWATSSRWSSSDNDFCLREGEEVGLIYGYVYDGLYSFDEFDRVNFNYVAKEGTVNGDGIYGTQPGRPKFKDLSGPEGKPDGIIDEYDRTIIGNTNPRLQGGFSLSGQWKNFDFNANFTYMLNFDLINATAYELSSAYGSSQSDPKNVLADFNYENRWVYYGDIYNADGTLYNANEMLYSNSQHNEYMDVYQSINANKTLWNPNDVTERYTHSYFIEDGSFLRLQDITIGYTLPEKLTSNWGISRLRVYVTGSNLFCLTGYSGYDPEIDIQSGLTPSVDYNRYPRSRGYLFGLNISF